MTRFITALTLAVVLSGVSALAQAVTHTPDTVTLTAQARTNNSQVTTVGCIRLWRPAPADPKQMPPDRQPGIAGIYLLTPLAAGNPASVLLPTYVLTPSATLNFWQNLDKKVEIIGTAQAALATPTAQEVIAMPPRPENRISVQSMPRLTVTSMKVLTDGCP